MSLKNAIRARFRNSDKSEKMGSGEDKEEEAPIGTTLTNVSCRKITRPGKMNIPEEDVSKITLYQKKNKFEFLPICTSLFPF